MMTNGFDQFQKLGKDNVDLAMKSLSAASKGFQSIAAEVTDYSKKSFEDGALALEQVVGAKSLDKALEAQGDYVRKAYEGYVGQMTKLGEIYADLAREVYQPLQDAVSKVAGTAGTAAR